MFRKYFKKSTLSETAQTPKSRRLRMEGLEARELLSVTPTGAETLDESTIVATLGEAAEVPTIDLSALTEAGASAASVLASETAVSSSTLTSTTLTVTTNLDVVDATDGVLSLREAISAAKLGSTITFDPSLKGATIQLSGSQLEINQSLTVDASSLYDATTQTPGITIDADGKSRVFYISGGTTANPVELIGLTVTDGRLFPYWYENWNDSKVSAGAGVYIDSGVTTFTNCAITDNRAYAMAGGVYICENSATTFTNCSITDNEFLGSGETGGVRADGTTTFVNCLVSGNKASLVGGVLVGGGTTILVNCTVAGNIATDSDGGYGVFVYRGSALALYNTIVALNNSADLGSHESVEWTNASSLIGVDPRFVVGPVFDDEGNLANADSLDLRLSEESWAIDRGDNTYVAESATDLDGNLRIEQAWESAPRVDIGAYEYQGTVPKTYETPSLIVTTGEDVVDAADGWISLREAIFYAETGAASGAAITFSPSLKDATITLKGSQLVVSEGITIDASRLCEPVSQTLGITIDAGGESRVFALLGGTNDAPIKLIGLTITGGEIDDLLGRGGGVYVNGTATFTNCAISGNSARSNSGGVYVDGTATFTNCAISGNSAGWNGGGVCVDGTATFTNCAISGNSAGLYGGGVNSAGTLVVTNCTVSGNAATSGGGIYAVANGCVTKLCNVLAALNFAKDSDPNIAGLISTDSANNALGFDPKFVVGPIFDGNGNLTNGDSLDLRLTAESWAIDRGENSYLDNVTIDLAGEKRAQRSWGEETFVDIGAYEFQGSVSKTSELPALVVTTPLDVVDDTDGEISLREALYYAERYPLLGSTITFAKSMKGKTIELKGMELAISKELTIDASSLYDVRLRRPGITINANGQSRVFCINTDVGKVELTGLKITGGRTAAYDRGGVYGNVDKITFTKCLIANNDCGGVYLVVDGVEFVDSTVSNNAGDGVYVNSGNATFRNGDFSGNEGNGVRVYFGGASSTTFTNCLINNNLESGVGVDFSDLSAYWGEASTTTFTNCAITGNMARGIEASYGETSLNNCLIAENKGGGVDLWRGNARFIGCSIKGNTVPDEEDGGGVCAMFVESVMFSNCAITDNATADSGGGVYIYTFNTSVGPDGSVTESSAIFENCLISDNTATSSGGGISTHVHTTTFTNCAIIDNAASYGGGVAGDGVFVNCSISGNAAELHGGGVYAYSGTTTLTNCSISGNTAGYGGGVYASSSSTTMTLYNSIVALNTASSSGADVCEYNSSATINAYNTLSSYAAWDAGSNNYVYDASQPLFKDAANGDYTLAANSQALNKGNDAYAVDGSGAPLTLDLAGNPRFYGNAVDLGAYESQVVKEPLATPSLNVEPRAAGALTVAIGYVPGAYAYLVEYSTDPTFGVSTTRTFTSSGSKKLADLDVGATYYARVKALGDGDYVDSKWSATRSARAVEILATPTFTVATRAVDALTVAIRYVANAAYLVEYSTDPTFATSSTRVFSSSGSKKIAGLNGNETYYVRVMCLGDGGYGDSAWAETASAKTAAIKLAAPTLTVVGRDETTLTATIGYASGAAAYEVEYSTDPDFTKSTTRVFTSNGAKKIRVDDARTTYYLRVKAVGSGAYVDSAWSGVERNFTAPSLTVVARSSSSLTATIGYVSNATSYVVEYSTDSTFATFATKTFASSGPKKIGELTEYATYYVRVKACGEGVYAESIWSKVEAARTATPLETPTLTVAARDVASLSLKIGYVSCATAYEVEYSTDPTFATSATRVFTSSGAKKLTGLAENSTYYVRVKAVGEELYADSVWSSASSAGTAPPLEPPTFAVEPRDATSLSATVGYVSYATSYEVEYSTDPTFATSTTKIFASSGPKKLGGLLENVVYYVRVRALNGTDCADSVWSEVAAIKTVPPLAAPTVSLELRDATSLNLTIGYIAYATSYEVEYSTDPTFAQATTRYFTSSGVKKLSGLTSDLRYYVRVKAENGTIYADSGWSSVVSETPVATSSSALTDEVFASPFDDFDFWEEDDENKFWPF